MTYRAPMLYTKEQLLRYQIKDMLVDIRCAYRDGHEAMAMEREREVLALAFGSPKMDQWGYFR